MNEHTESSNIFGVLKSLYITSLSASWRKASPLAAPNAIFILVDHGNVAEDPAWITTKKIRNQTPIECK